MIFNSVTYLLFLPAIVIFYWVIRGNMRLWIVFLASITFYAFWRIEFVPVMMFSVVVDYFVSIRLANSKIRNRFKWLLVSLIANLGLLFYFKYLLFFSNNTIGLLNLLGYEISPLMLNIILPLGISFYTFQTISYTIDVYRGFIEPERNFILYGCYVTFFPQLVAGPILRAAEVIPQFRNRPDFDFEDIGIGLRRVLYGLFLKVVLADNISPLVDQGFGIPVDQLSALDVWTLAFLFGLQIYFDFSAYSHIALGSARLFGIRFPENFNFPYVSVSPRDFWRRWHISLSSWIRDYLYLPLTGAKVHDRSIGGLAGAASERGENQMFALFATWAIMGLWHGASWTFVLWGLYHATWIALYRLTLPFLQRFSRVTRTLGGWLITLPVAMLGWIAFRAESVTDAFDMWSKVFIPSQYLWLGMRENSYLVTATLTLCMIITYLAQHWLSPVMRKRALIFAVHETLVISIVIGFVFVFLRPINQFIYFQF